MTEANRPILNRAVTSKIADLSRRFAEAQPFRHVLIENFFADDVLAELIRQFPAPDPSKMVNEFGRGSKKFARHDVRNIGSVYEELDDYIRSPQFAAVMSELTGIPHLLYDPEYHGAGTHDNHDGQGMDPHVDFNLHRTTGYHRRLNAIIYLNEEWDPQWGGNLELHKDPWDPAGDEVLSYPPFLNHCVLFETNEYSWHGFHPVTLPPGKNISRKSFTIYMYTKDRPLNEIADKHGTIYVPRPLPDKLQAGYTLAAEDVEHLKQDYQSRALMIHDLYDREKKFQDTIARLTQFERNFTLPRQGWGVQVGPATGLMANNGVGRSLSARFRVTRDVRRVSLVFRKPDFLAENELTIEIDKTRHNCTLSEPTTQFSCAANIEKGATVELNIWARDALSPKAAGIGADKREFGFYVTGVTFE